MGSSGIASKIKLELLPTVSSGQLWKFSITRHNGAFKGVVIMRFAQFFTMSTGYIHRTIPPQFGTPSPIEACGSNGVLILDGGLSLHNAATIATKVAKERGYIGFSIHQGESFNRSRELVGFKDVK